MILWHKKEGLRKFLLPPVLLLFLIALSLNWSGCAKTGEQADDQTDTGDTPQNEEEVPEVIDHLEVAKTMFREKVFPFFNNPRCVNCHDFANLRTTIFAGHPPPDGDPTTCTGCHATGTVGFAGWVEAPANNNWVLDDDPDRVRQQSIDQKGADLFKHLIGEGADADPFVQWAFKDPPNEAPPNVTPPLVKPGAVPGGLPPHNGQIPDDELMVWADFKKAVEDWICAESMVPGAVDLGKPDTLDCNVP